MSPINTSAANVRNYLFSRVERSNYRGAHITQHNRLPFGKALPILRALHAVAGKAAFAIPRDNQITQGHLAPKFEKYLAMVNQAGSTLYTLKKVFFPDFGRMGLLNRMDQYNRVVPLRGKHRIVSACLTETAVQLVQVEESEAKQMYEKATQRLIQKKVMTAMEIALAEFSRLSVWEYMLILSDLHLSNEQAINLLKEYRALSGSEQESLRREIKGKCEYISAKAQDKEGKRDFGNWLNEANSAFVIFQETGLFKVQGTGKQAMIALCPE